MGATGRGDKGKTSILGGKEVWKDNSIIKSIGAIDELNTLLGLCYEKAKNKQVKEQLNKIQKELFIVGSYLSGYAIGTSKNIPESRIKEIEKIIKELMPLHKKPRFILPRGTESALFLQLARAVCRRAERNIITTIKEEGEKPGCWGLVKYINRLSDLLYYFALLENKEAGIEETYV